MQGIRGISTVGAGRRAPAALVCVVAAGVLGWAAPARSDTQPAPSGLATLSPKNVGAASHLKLDAEGPGGGLESGKLPTSLAFALQKGFTVDTSAVSGVCSNSQADNSQCPDSSRFAAGTIDLVARGGGFSPSGSHYTANLTLYVAPPQQAGDPAGAVFYFNEPSSGFHGSSRGRIDNLSDPTYATEVRFDKLPLPSLPPGFSFDLQSLKLDVGVIGGQSAAPPGSGTGAPTGAGTAPGAGRRRHSRHARRKKHRHHHKSVKARRHAARRARVASASSLLVNPATCSGSWSVRLQIGFSDGVQERDASAPCTS